MKHSVSITTTAQRQFKKFPSQIKERLRKKLLSLENHPRPFGSQKLKGPSEFYRLRIGDYRVVYSVNDAHKHVKILDIAHRREVYR
jgi:mRNA interferase RelE/StbE